MAGNVCCGEYKHLLQLLQSGGCWKQLHFSKALKIYSCFALACKIYSLGMNRFRSSKKKSLGCLLLCNLWSAQDISWFHMIVYIPISSTKFSVCHCEKKTVESNRYLVRYLVISTGSFEKAFKTTTFQTLPRF